MARRPERFRGRRAVGCRARRRRIACWGIWPGVPPTKAAGRCELREVLESNCLQEGPHDGAGLSGSAGGHS